MSFARRSRWKFITSNGAGGSVGVVGAEGGSVTLAEPTTDKKISFYYGALGVGISFGVKLPKIRKLTIPGFVGSSESFTSLGTVYMASQFRGKELTSADIDGGICFGEIAGGAAWGAGGYALAFGMNPALMAAASANASLLSLALASSTGYLFFAGGNFGFQAGGGVTGFAGVMYSA